MRTQSVVVLALVGVTTTVITAQHEGHQNAASGAPSAEIAQCSQAQTVVGGLLEAAMKRVETARLTNSAAAMRDAVDDVQSALLDIRQQLAPCSQLQPAAADPHAGHAAPAVQQPPAATPGTPATQPRSPAPVPGARAPAVSGPGGGTNLRPAPPTDVASLKCRTPIEAKTAPRMLHQGRMYYFCSEEERAAFAKDPSMYAPPAADQAAPAHAH
jgi:YHS domain-containing protein